MLQHLIDIYNTGDISDIDSSLYCATRDVFRARHDKWYTTLSEKIGIPKAAQLLTIVGEVGNNSYDHNLGHWQSSPGLCFYSEHKSVLLFDQGRGIKSSLSGAGHLFENESEYLKAALTQRITGRAPERRGNGLKVSLKIAESLNISFYIRSGLSFYHNQYFKNKSNLDFSKCNNKGVLVLINFENIV